MRRYIIVLLSMLAICSVPCQSQTIDRALFERMVAITKHFEGWHDPKTTPGYVGYGHQLQKGERFPKTLTRQRADLLLRTDLLRHLRLYARYGRDAYLLATLSYQIGPAKLLGTIPESVPAHPIGTWRQGHPATLSELLQMEGKSSGIH